MPARELPREDGDEDEAGFTGDNGGHEPASTPARPVEIHKAREPGGNARHPAGAAVPVPGSPPDSRPEDE